MERREVAAVIEAAWEGVRWLRVVLRDEPGAWQSVAGGLVSLHDAGFVEIQPNELTRIRAMSAAGTMAKRWLAPEPTDELGNRTVTLRLIKSNHRGHLLELIESAEVTAAPASNRRVPTTVAGVPSRPGTPSVYLR
jgi:hypothetical protein